MNYLSGRCILVLHNFIVYGPRIYEYVSPSQKLVTFIGQSTILCRLLNCNPGQNYCPHSNYWLHVCVTNLKASVYSPQFNPSPPKLCWIYAKWGIKHYIDRWGSGGDLCYLITMSQENDEDCGYATIEFTGLMKLRAYLCVWLLQCSTLWRMISWASRPKV